MLEPHSPERIGAEEASSFFAGNKQLFGIWHLAEARETVSDLIVMVTGGPQTRVGSHRSYVQIARGLYAEGCNVFRFDYEGLGDGAGEFVGFLGAEPSIRSAIEFAKQKLPSLKHIVLWSLCDGSAASILFGGEAGDLIEGMILSNPYSNSTAARAAGMLKGYYLRRLRDPEFWRKVTSLRFNPLDALKSVKQLRQQANGSESEQPNSPVVSATQDPSLNPLFDERGLPQKLEKAMAKFQKPIFVFLSGNDITADEFRTLVHRTPSMRRQLRQGQIRFIDIPQADHTFSRQEWKTMVKSESVKAFRHIIESARRPQ